MTAAGGLISLVLGTVLLRLTFTGAYGRYVRQGMGPWLAVAGVAVIILGLVTLVRALRHADPAEAHEHQDRGGTRMGWLLLAPIAALLLVAPPTLGSYGVGRGTQVDIRSGGAVFTRLAPGAAPATMTLLEFGQRAFDRDGASFGVAVQLTGFNAGAADGGFRLARYQISCCAADAAPVVLRVIGIEGGGPRRDQWVTVTGTYQPGGGDLPELTATSVVDISPPEDPYE